MDNERLVAAIELLPTDLTDVGILTTIETGFDSLFTSLANISTKASADQTLVSNIDDILATVHAKIDGALHTFIHLSEIAKDLKTKGEKVLETLKKIYNLMISLLQSLRPVEELVCKYYPMLAPIFEAINLLPKIS